MEALLCTWMKKLTRLTVKRRWLIKPVLLALLGGLALCALWERLDCLLWQASRRGARLYAAAVSQGRRALSATRFYIHRAADRLREQADRLRKRLPALRGRAALLGEQSDALLWQASRATAKRCAALFAWAKAALPTLGRRAAALRLCWMKTIRHAPAHDADRALSAHFESPVPAAVGRSRHRPVYRLAALSMALCMVATGLPLGALGASGTFDSGRDSGHDSGAGPDLRIGWFEPLTDDLLHQTVAPGVPQEELALPGTLTVSLYDASLDSGAGFWMTALSGFTWQSQPDYDGATPGVYVFTPVPPQGHRLAPGVVPPQITITVGGPLLLKSAAITLRVNKTDTYTGASLQAAMEKCKLTDAEISILEVTAGDITAADWEWMATASDSTSGRLRYLEQLYVLPTVNSVADLPAKKTIPSDVTDLVISKLKVINGANPHPFGGLLVNASFPDLAKIGDHAFACQYFTSLTLGATPPTVEDGSFSHSGSLAASRTLTLVDSDGTPLTGDTLATALATYRAAPDGDITDNVWYGWSLSPVATQGAITVVLNGETLSGANLEDILEKYSFNYPRTLEITAGKITPADWEYLRAKRKSGIPFDNMTSFVVSPGVSVDDIVGDTYGVFPESLTTLSVANLKVLGKSAASGLKLLQTANFPDVTSVGDNAFRSAGSANTADSVVFDLPKLQSAGASAFYESTAKTFTLPNLTTAGASAFSNANQMTSITLPKLTVAPDSAFYNCSALKTVSLPEAAAIGKDAFSNCSALTSVDAPKVTTINGNQAFGSCTSLKTLNLPELTTVNGNETFYSCTKLESVDFPKLTTIGTSFLKNCTSLKSVSLPLLTVLPKETFGFCSSLTEVDLPSVTDVGEKAFDRCNALTTLTLPKAESLGTDAFSNCKALTSVVFPKLTAIGTRSLSGCSGLDELGLPAAPPTVGAVGSFSSVPYSRVLLLVDDSGQPLEGTAFADALALYTAAAKTDNKDDSKWWGWPLPTAAPVISVSLNGNAPVRATDLKSAVAAAVLKDYPQDDSSFVISTLTVTGGKVTAADWQAFSTFTQWDNYAECSKLTRVELSGKLTSVANLPAVEGGLFPPSIQQVILPGVEVVGTNAFLGCKVLETAVLPNVKELGQTAFSGCDALTSLTLPAAPPTADASINVGVSGRALTLVDAVNVPLEGDPLLAAQHAYDMADQTAAVGDRLWHGWSVGEYTWSHTVTFDSQGGTAVESVSVAEDTAIAVLPVAPTRAGFVFMGWFTGKNGGGTAFTVGTKVNADITLYAKWRADGTDLPLTGTVLDAAGKPQPGASVTVTEADGTQHGPVVTDANGQYTFPGLDAGDYTLTVVYPDGVTATGQVTLSPDGSVAGDAALAKPTPTVVISVQPRDLTVLRGSGASLSVTASLLPAGAPSYHWYLMKGAAPNPAADTLLGTGSAYRADGLAAAVGRYRLYCLVSGPGAAGVSTRVATLTVEGATDLSGVVTDANGNPLPGASVTVSNSVTGEHYGPVVTGSGGDWTVSGLPDGRYDIIITLPGGGVITRPVTLPLASGGSIIIGAPPSLTVSILRQPADATVLQQETAALTVEAGLSGAGALTYQWYQGASNSPQGGTALPGATAASLRPSTAAPGTRYYYCVVSADGAASATSRAARLTVRARVTVEGVITDAAGKPLPGVSVTLTDSVTGQTFGPALTGDDGRWTLPGLPAGDYILEARYPDGSSSSGTISIAPGGAVSGSTELQRPARPTIAIAVQPRDLVVTRGGNATLSVTATLSGGQGLSYQWYARQGGSDAPIPGATGSTYAAPTGQVGARVYLCRVSAPDAEPVLSRPATVTVRNTTSGTDAGGIVTDSSGKPLPGATVTLTDREDNANQTTVTTGPDGSWTAPGLPDGVYDITVTLPDGSLLPGGSITVIDGTVTGGGTAVKPPVVPVVTILSQPRDLAVTLGGPALLEVVASASAGTPRYQWLAHDTLTGQGQPIANATGATFAPPTDAVGQSFYSCVVSAPGAADLSTRVATLTVRAASSTSGTLAGVVTDEWNQPLAGVAVKLMKGGTDGVQIGQTVMTDPAGGFAFPATPYGSYSLVAMLGQQVVTRQLSISAPHVEETLVLPSGNKNTRVVVRGGAPSAATNGLDGLFTADDDIIAARPSSRVEIKLVIDSLAEGELPDGERQHIAGQLAPEQKVGLYLDMTLLKTIVGASGQNVSNRPIQPPAGQSVKIVLDLPAALQGQAPYSIVRVHEGSTVLLPADYDEELNTLTFETDRFSTYAIVGTPRPGSGDPSEDSTQGGASAPDSDEFWRQALARIAEGGDQTLALDASAVGPMPWTVMEALRQNPGVALQLRWSGTTLVIPAGRALSDEPNRIYWPMALLAERYGSQPALEAPLAPEAPPVRGGGVPVAIAEPAPLNPSMGARL